jgi:hypothetical protein
VSVGVSVGVAGTAVSTGCTSSVGICATGPVSRLTGTQATSKNSGKKNNIKKSKFRFMINL